MSANADTLPPPLAAPLAPPLPEDILSDPLAAQIAARFAPPVADTHDDTLDAPGEVQPGEGQGATTSSDAQEPEHADTHDEEVAPPSTLAVPLPDGTSFALDVDAAQRLLALASWAEANSQHAPAFDGIEHGTHVAVPRADYEAFVAWQQTRSGSAPRPASNETLDRLADLDPDAAEQYRTLIAENERLRATVAQPDPRSVARERAALEAEERRAEAIFRERVNAWAAQRNIDAATADNLLNTAVRHGVIAQFVNADRQYNPATGQVLVEADLGRVAEQAMNYALVLDPDLYTRVSSAPPPSPSTTPDPVSAKKARSASLAATPSASVALPAKDPRTMNDAEHTAAIAEAIRHAAGEGT